MNMRHLPLLFVFLAGCATLDKTNTATINPQVGASYPMEFEGLPPEQITPGHSLKKSSQKKTSSHTVTQTTQALYIGQRGYLSRPPKFSDPNLEKSFQRCAPVEITGVYQSGKTIFVYVKQNGYTYPMVGLNRKDFTRTASKKLPLLDRFFVKDLAESPTGRQIASEKQKVCSGQTWKDMPQQQFLFVSGDPEYRRPVKNANGQYDVWTYSGPNQNNSRHYYFLSNKLYSWTQ
jgi:hypothetical protein